MTTTTRPPTTQDDTGFLTATLTITTAMGVAVGASVTAAELPHLLTDHTTLTIALRDVWPAAAAAFTHPAHPALAFPAAVRPDIAGPVAYWSIALLIAAVVGAFAVVIYRLLRTQPQALDRRTRFDQPVDARLATRHDINTLRLRNAREPDRIVLGRAHRTVLATNNNTPPRNHKAFQRWAGPSHVMVTAPTRTGKTHWLAQALTLWDNPAVVLSVKTDLLHHTLAARQHLGDVRVCGFITTPPPGTRWATWDLLADATTWDGANRLAKHLASVAPTTSNARGRDEGWIDQATNILAIELYLARHTNHTMHDIVDWTFALAPNPDEGTVAHLRHLATTLTTHHNPHTAADAQRALNSLTSAATGSTATWTGVYMTARRLVTPWLHPAIRTFTTPGPDTITLDWLRQPANTLYVIASIADSKDTSPALGAFIARLIHTALTNTTTNDPLPVLFALDEMANIHFRDLPEWSSVAASAGIRLITVWQSLAQITALYADHAHTITNNHVTKLFLGANSDQHTLDTGSYLTGTEHTPAHHTALTNEPHALTTTPIINPSLLRRIPKGRALLIHANLPPIDLHILTPKHLHRLQHNR